MHKPQWGINHIHFISFQFVINHVLQVHQTIPGVSNQAIIYAYSVLVDEELLRDLIPHGISPNISFKN